MKNLLLPSAAVMFLMFLLSPPFFLIPQAAAKERVRMAGVSRDLEMALAELDFINEKKRAAREFEDHKLYLR